MKFLIFHRYARRAPVKAQSQPEWHGVRWMELVPSLTLILFLIITQIPLGVLKHIHLAPSFMVMSVYFWSVYQPQNLKLWFLFLLGMLADLITAEPLLGISSFLFVGIHAVLMAQNHFFRAQNFVLLWIGFVVLISFTALLHAILAFIFLPTVLDFSVFVLTILMNAALYPLVALLLNSFQRMGNLRASAI